MIRPLKPDVGLVLDTMAALGLPTLDSLPVDDARAFMLATAAMTPPGAEVGEVLDGTLTGAAGDLPYRLYRPPTEGPHPVVVYFHGGGWVLGNLDSDDPFCRQLCLDADAIIVSVNYRHAPEARFPAAADDAVAAVQWVAGNAADLGGVPGKLAVCGWSAGGNVAAVAAQAARDAGGPALSGQVLINPSPTATSPASHTSNGDGYMLTTDLMKWFWDHYADPADRTDPRAAPLRAAICPGCHRPSW